MSSALGNRELPLVVCSRDAGTAALTYSGVSGGRHQASATLSLTIVDTATGEGTLHCQTKEQRGRKYWAWGNDPSDLTRLYFLSSCTGGSSGTDCLGAYLETQSGVVPTQM